MAEPQASCYFCQAPTGTTVVVLSYIHCPDCAAAHGCHQGATRCAAAPTTTTRPRNPARLQKAPRRTDASQQSQHD